MKFGKSALSAFYTFAILTKQIMSGVAHPKKDLSPKNRFLAVTLSKNIILLQNKKVFVFPSHM